MSFWIDIHAHLDDLAFQNDLSLVLERASCAGVSWILSAGVSYQSSLKTLEIAKNYASVYAALGIHPQEVRGRIKDLAPLELLLKEEKVVAIGEVGLDYYWDRTYVVEQREVFRAQIALAERYGLPLLVHSRQAESEVLRILDEEAVQTPVIWHCFSGDHLLLQKLVRRGFYLSVNGILTYPKAQLLREVIACAPREQVFIETDAPYLSPQERRGKRNEPAFLLGVARLLAELWGVGIATVQEQIILNWERVFGREPSKIDGQELR